MNFLIIDDDKYFGIKLEEKILNKYTHAKCDIINTKPNINELKDNYTVIIIDILLGQYNGIDIAKYLKKYFPKSYFVFISNYNELIFQTQIVSPLCFIRKNELDFDFNIFINLLSEKKTEGKKLFFKLDNSFSNDRNTNISIDYEDIVYIECYLHNIIINTFKKQYVVKSSLKNFMDKVKYYNCFIQIHRSYVINMKYIYRISNSTVHMLDESAKNELELGLKYKKDFEKAFEEFLLL